MSYRGKADENGDAGERMGHWKRERGHTRWRLGLRLEQGHFIHHDRKSVS